ncbi:RNA polymerase sigma factor [Caulobacter segnis]|uniref:RNA polymerase sigma factor n=1 Tax=Caulobacter segnis TaxID=88688 RepID=UPI00240F08A7|nr:RNA polymerase sigma factor [Caulobacter segnis]MDG2520400.1 RNA polymerase sigma factor [Caulobacter segnis]
MSDRPEGAGAAQGELTRAYLARRGDLVRFFAARLRSMAAAEDLVQELYVKIRQAPDAPVANPDGLLFTIASNLMLDRQRGDRRARARDERWTEANLTILGGQAVQETPSAEAALAAKRRLTRMLTLMRDLPPRTQEAFKLHKLEGLSHAQTAARMGISAKTVEKQISAALRAILERLEPDDEI